MTLFDPIDVGDESKFTPNKALASLIKLRFVILMGERRYRNTISKETFIIPHQVTRFINIEEWVSVLRDQERKVKQEVKMRFEHFLVVFENVLNEASKTEEDERKLKQKQVLGQRSKSNSQHS